MKIYNSDINKAFEQAVKQFMSDLAYLAEVQEKVVIGLVGGRSVAALYRMLAKVKSLAWNQCEFVILDERYVPLDSEESNFKLIQETFFEPLLKGNQISKDQIHPWNTSLEGNAVAQDYGIVLEQLGGSVDLAIVSTGEDGHIAGIFPTKDYSTDELYIYFEDSPKPPKKRLSITPYALAKAKKAYVLFVGEDKQKALHQFIESDERTNPQQTLDALQNVVIITDQTP